MWYFMWFLGKIIGVFYVVFRYVALQTRQGMFGQSGIIAEKSALICVLLLAAMIWAEESPPRQMSKQRPKTKTRPMRRRQRRAVRTKKADYARVQSYLGR